MEEGDHHVDDDFFGDEDGSGGDDDVAYHRAMGERNYNRLHAIHATAGFREGVGEASEDEVVQAGFNAGFREGAAVAFRRSLQRALFTAVIAAHGDAEAVAAVKDDAEAALRLWERRPIAEAGLCEEQARVEEELMPRLLRAAGLPDQLCDSTQLTAHNPFALNGP